MADPQILPQFVCTKCGQAKPHTREFFSPYPNRTLRNKCKACCAAETKEWRRRNPDKVAAMKRREKEQRRWTPDIEELYPLRRCSKCKEAKPNNPVHYGRGGKRDGLARECKACQSRRHAENRETDNKRNRAAEIRRRERDPVAFREKRNSWRAENREALNQRHRQWRSDNADKVKPQRVAEQAKRRAWKVSAGGEFTRDDVARLLRGQKGRCWWCSCKLTAYHVDHRIPLSRGGSNDVGNLVISCPACNLSKNAKMPWEFRSRLL